MAKTKFDLAWEALFADLNLSEQIRRTGIAAITATQIKSISKEEPRLMAKWDERSSRPQPLRDANVTIFPVSNGDYRLVAADGYTDIPPPGHATLFSWPNRRNYQTLPVELRSESQVIDACAASGLLQQFTGESDLILTVRGRLRTPLFEFDINDIENRTHKLAVEGVQVELDAGYEGGQRFYVLESKMTISSSLITRQLYYPYRMWRALGIAKPIVPLYVGYSNKTLTIIEFEVDRESVYEALRIKRHQQFVFDDRPPDRTLSDLVKAIKPQAREPDHPPFPQADSLARVIDTIDLVARGLSSKDDISEAWAYDERQGDYYSNAAIYLGMLERDGRNTFTLTTLGRDFLEKSPRQRIQLLAEQALKNPVFHAAASYAVEKKHHPTTVEAANWIAQFSTLAGTTPRRRAGTVISWNRRFVEDLW